MYNGENSRENVLGVGKTNREVTNSMKEHWIERKPASIGQMVN